MSGKHTPGPWRACGEDKGGCQCGMVWSTSVDVIVAVAVTAADEAYTCGAGITDPAEQIANARLIAAAPDLLAACEAMYLWLQLGHAEDDKFGRTIKAAIAKAEATQNPVKEGESDA